MSAFVSVHPGYVSLDKNMKNVTKYTQETVRLKCEITGDPVPRYLWSKNDVPIDESDSRRYSVKTTPWGSRYVQCGVSVVTYK